MSRYRQMTSEELVDELTDRDARAACAPAAAAACGYLPPRRPAGGAQLRAFLEHAPVGVHWLQGKHAALTDREGRTAALQAAIREQQSFSHSDTHDLSAQARGTLRMLQEIEPPRQVRGGKR